MSIWMASQIKFEDYQGTKLGSGFIGGSSFSVEDLTSDYFAGLIGIEAIFPGRGASWETIKSTCGALSPKDSRLIFKNGRGPLKSKSHLPALWKPFAWTPKKCWPCSGKDVTLPTELFTLSPYYEDKYWEADDYSLEEVSEIK